MHQTLLTLGLLCALLLRSPVAARACTFVWDAVTTYTDGSAASGLKYKLYLQPVGASTPQTVADVPTPTATLACPAGDYWVTAYDPQSGQESARSTVVTLRQPKTPVNLKWTP
jgi:hypothetical protein